MHSNLSFSESEFPEPDDAVENFLVALPPAEGSEHVREPITPPSFESAFAALDHQGEQLQTLRATLERLHVSSEERERTLNRLETELSATRAEAEQHRALASALSAELAERDRVLGSVREAVSELGRVLDPPSPSQSWDAPPN